MSTHHRSALGRHPRRRIPDEGIILAVVAAVIGAIRVLIAVTQHEPFRAEATLGLGLVVVGCLGIAACLRHR
jgi:hypothetical protein